MIREGPLLRTRRQHVLALVVLVALHLGNSLLAIHHDQIVSEPDGADYFDKATWHAHRVRAGEPGAVLADLWSMAQRQPLAYVPAVALMSVIGGGDPADVRSTTLVWALLALVLVFCLGEELHSPAAGLLAAAVLAAMPGFMGFSRVIWFDVPLTAATAAVALALLRTRGFATWRASAWCGVVAGLGLLVKVALPVCLLPLAAGYLLHALLRSRRRWRVALHAGLAALIALALFATWAIPNLEGLFTALHMARPEVISAVEGPLRTHYSSERFTHYLVTLPLSLAGPVISALYLAGLVALVRWNRRRALTLTSLWLWGGLALLSFLFVPWTRYALPLSPAIALVVAVGALAVPAIARRAAWSVPLGVALLTAFAVQQTWLGPEAVWCAEELPVDRPQCAGMVRPRRTGLTAPALGLTTPDSLYWVAVTPRHFEPEPAPPPFDRPAAYIRWWMVIDDRRRAVGKTVECEVLPQYASFDPRLVDSFRFLFVAVPPRGLRVPPGQRPIHEATLRHVRRSGGSWRRVRTIQLPAGGEIQVHRNRARRDRPGAAVW